MKILGISGGMRNGSNDGMCIEALMGAKEMEPRWSSSSCRTCTSSTAPAAPPACRACWAAAAASAC